MRRFRVATGMAGCTAATQSRGTAWAGTAVLTLVLQALSFGPAAAEQADVITFRQLSSDVNSTEPKVRRAALRSLATMGPEALDPISLLVADPVRDIRSDAIQAVVRIYVEPPPKRQVRSPEEAFDWSPFLTTPWPVPPVLTTNLARALADDWPSERRDAAYALGVVLTPPIDPRVADELIYSLADPADDVRLAAVRVLGRLQVAKAGDHVIGRIVDPSLPVRLAAMRAVGELREARGLAALRQQLEFYETTTAGRTAFDAICRIAHPSSAGLIEQERFSRNEENRRAAYEGVARLGLRDADAAGVEQRLTEERNEEVRLAMAFALAASGRPYLERVVRATADPRLADQAMPYLVELGRVSPDSLLPFLQDPDPVVRARVAVATGIVGGPQAEVALGRLTADGDPSVRRAAEAGVVRVRAGKQPASTK